jgi:hypothetical protein
MVPPVKINATLGKSAMENPSLLVIAINQSV